MPVQDWSVVVESTAEPAFVLDSRGTLVGWNASAERLFGRTADQVVGKPCCEIVSGSDLFGNRFCSEECALRCMIERQEPVHGYQLVVRSASGPPVRVQVSALSLPDPHRGRVILHLLHPVEPDAACKTAPGPLREPTRLTARQIEILRLLADGATTEETASALFISATTVRAHVQNIFRKLGAHSKLQAVAIARRGGLL